MPDSMAHRSAPGKFNKTPGAGRGRISVSCSGRGGRHPACRRGWHLCHPDRMWPAVARANLPSSGRNSRPFPPGWKPGSMSAKD